jgi:hypothetical protein
MKLKQIEWNKKIEFIANKDLKIKLIYKYYNEHSYD